MKTIGITGGIGSGKSHLARLIAAQGYPVFYADEQAKHILRSNASLQAALSQLVGEEIFVEGVLQKKVLAAYLCQGKEYSQQVDALVHPYVRAAWQDFCCAHAQHRLVFMECALLFESGFDNDIDAHILVHCDEEERIARVMRRDKKDRATVLRWIALQMPEEEKEKRATYVVSSSSEAEELAQLRALGLLP